MFIYSSPHCQTSLSKGYSLLSTCQSIHTFSHNKFLTSQLHNPLNCHIGAEAAIDLKIINTMSNTSNDWQ